MPRIRSTRNARVLAAILALMPLVLLAGGQTQSIQAQTFFAGFEDVPVMPALSVVENAGIDFDAPSGRIAEAYAIGRISPKAVLDFYRTSLQQLGWREVADAMFEREGEFLRLDFEVSDGELTVRFRISPVGAGADDG